MPTTLFPRRRMRLALATAGAVLAGTVVLLVPRPAQAYNVCLDQMSCVHELMTEHAIAVIGGGEVLNHARDVRFGAGHEDAFDHVYGYEWDGILESAWVTITHFWDADRGPDDRVEYAGSLAYPNAWQKARSLWSLALGAYARGDKQVAYRYVGHVAHLIGDMTVPTHVHDDTHVDAHDDDPFEEWMSGEDRPLVTDEELAALKELGPIPIPPEQPDKLFWLMHTTNQITDFFPSMDAEGDAHDPLGWVQDELDEMARTITSPRTIEQLEDNDDGNHNDDGDLGRIREHTYIRGIRAIASLYQLFEETVTRQSNLVVLWEALIEDEAHDDLDNDPDYWTWVEINGVSAQNRGHTVHNVEDVINPGWAFAQPVGVAGSAPVKLQVWDHDGWDGSPFDPDVFNPDGPSDIDPDLGAGDRTVELNVDLAKCIRREAAPSPATSTAAAVRR